MDYWDELEETERAEKRAALLTRLPEAIENLSDVQKKRLKAQVDTELLTKLLSNPETAALLKVLASKL